MTKASTLIRPLAARVAVQRVGLTETAAGIIIPETARKQNIGTVVAVGPGLRGEKGWEELEVKVGDRVAFSEHSGQEIESGGEKFLIIQEYDLICVLL